VTDTAKVETPAPEEAGEGAPKDGGDTASDGGAAVEIDGFEALWKRVLESWDDDKLHGAFLEFALRTERLPDAAGRYRALKDGDPAKSERAKKQLDAIVIAATHMMMSMKTPPPTKVPLSITLSAFGIFLFTLCFVVYMYLHR